MAPNSGSPIAASSSRRGANWRGANAASSVTGARPFHGQIRCAIEEEDAFDEGLGMFHLVDGLLLDKTPVFVVLPVLAHFIVEFFLVDGRQFFFQGGVQCGDYVWISLHNDWIVIGGSGPAKSQRTY